MMKDEYDLALKKHRSKLNGVFILLTHHKWQVTRTNRKWNGCNDYA